MIPAKIQFRQALPSLLPAILIVIVQASACLFFVLDALSDGSSAAANGQENLLETGVALALFAGTALGATYLFRMAREIRVRSTALAIARSSLSTIIAERFIEWGLSPAESDVALFALKGCAIGDIADLRSAAPGTVRAQLSQVYAKAGVTSQAMLMSLFLEELIETSGPSDPQRPPDPSL